MCATADRFFDMGIALASMVVSLVDQPSTRLLKHIVRCYLRLSVNPRLQCRACAALQTVLPDMLKDGTFSNSLREDASIQHLLQQLLVNVVGGTMGGATHSGLHMTGTGI